MEEQKELKNLYYVSKKRELVKLYISQYSEYKIRDNINKIIREKRPNEALYCHNITYREFLEFISIYGLPVGYKMSPILKIAFEKYLQGEFI